MPTQWTHRAGRICCGLALAGYITVPAAGAAAYASYADVRAVLSALADLLPAELKTRADESWPAWAQKHDADIRARLARGDDDTIVNWLLLGTTFTSRPRAILGASSTDVVQIPAAVASRARDLIAALARPVNDERRLFVRRVLEAKGYRLDTAANRERLEDYLLTDVARVAREQAAHARDLDASRRLGDVSDEFAARSHLFRTRGLSLDTSLPPSFALEKALAALQARGLLKPGSIQDVAVIGPGLDFSDKSSGYDFYPQQTLQPFALVDSLLRLGLAANAASVRLTTLDLSPRVNEHLAAAKRRAASGRPYVVRLPLDSSVSWKTDVVSYWNTAGDRIGQTAAAASLTTAGQVVRMREITVPAVVVRQIRPEDINIVVQRLDDRQFDLVVATNVFIYYDVLDQALAMANVEAMLRPGGFLLSNNALLELPSSRLRSVGYLTVEYSDRPDDGDHIVWYQAR